MLSISALILLIVIGVLLFYWQTSARARELAIKVSKEICEQQHLQFLDGTTALKKISLKRGRNGKVGILRHYQFDYFDGHIRQTGMLLIWRHRVLELMISPSQTLENQTSENPDEKPSLKSANDKQHQRNNVIPFHRKKEDD